MRRIVMAAVSAIVLASSGGAQSYIVSRVQPRNPDAMHDVKIEKAALSGQEVRVWWASLLNADCSPAGTMTTQVVQAPRHGELRVSDDPFYPNYPTMNPRAACDSKLSAGKQAFYRSSDGFRGHDKMVLQNATSEGRMRRIVVDVDIR